MKLTPQETEAIQRFSSGIRAQFPGEILTVEVFGSKARGDARVDSDIDILVVTRSSDWRMGDAIRRAGYLLDEDIDYRFSVLVIPSDHYEHLRNNHYQFLQNVERDAFPV